MRKLLLALLVVAFMALPAAASVQNIKISGDIESTWLIRHQFDLGENTAASEFEQSIFFTQTRLRVDADLTDNVSATVALLNERVWDDSDDAYDEIDIDLAYVTLREMLYSPLTVVIGRQAFAFGNSFIMDSAGDRNLTNTQLGEATDLSKEQGLDAVRLTLDYNPLTVDVIYAKIDGQTTTGRMPQDDDVDLYGMNANYQLGDDMNTIIEAYFWAKLDQSTKTSATGTTADPTSGFKADTIYLPGVRASANILDGLNLQGELAFQTGTKVVAVGESTTPTIHNIMKRRAWATQVLSTYSLPFDKTAEYKPVLHGSYSYYSGDINPTETDTAGGKERYYTAWDQFFNDQGDGTIGNSLLAKSNLQVGNLGLTVVPMEDVTVSLDWYGYWLASNEYADDEASPDDGADQISITPPDGGGAIALEIDGDRGLATELGLGVLYDYTEDVQFGASYNYLWCGSALTEENNKPASQFMVSSKVTF